MPVCSTLRRLQLFCDVYVKIIFLCRQINPRFLRRKFSCNSAQEKCVSEPQVDISFCFLSKIATAQAAGTIKRELVRQINSKAPWVQLWATTRCCPPLAFPFPGFGARRR